MVTHDDMIRALASPMTKPLSDEGVDMVRIAKLIVRDMDRKKTKIVRIKGRLLEGEPNPLKTYVPLNNVPYRIVARSDSETVIAVEVEALDIQADARKDAARLLGLYTDRLELSGPGGGPLTYDSIPPEEREILLTISRAYEKEINRKGPGKKGIGEKSPA